MPQFRLFLYRWGLLTAKARIARNHKVPVVDGLLAATAQHHDLILVTRNVDDVAPTGVQLFSPWAERRGEDHL